MISEKQKQQIIKVLGHRYVAPIKKELATIKALDRNNNPHSSSYITNVMNGQPHAIIETAIFKAVATKKKLNKQNEQLLKSA